MAAAVALAAVLSAARGLRMPPPALRSAPRRLVRRGSGGARADDTIFALSSGRGVCGVAVVRVSGAGSDAVLGRLTGGAPLPAPRRAVLRTLSDGDGDALDEALVLRFVGPASFTGEDVVELHVHGGRATVDGVLEALADSPGVRAADRGEFTRRAFAAGRLGLTEVEGLADLLAASTAPQRRQALAVMGGALERTYAEWRASLASARASAEVLVDFGDDVEGDVADQAADIRAGLDASLRALAIEFRGALADGRRGEATREGVRVVLAGAPNAGKSSLLNALARRDAAIVTDVPGTTRDVLEVGLVLGGLPVRLFDTAGLRRDAADEVEVEGMRRASRAASAAHVVAFVLDASASDAAAPADAFAAVADALGDAPDATLLIVENKCDLGAAGGAAADALKAAKERHPRLAAAVDAAETVRAAATAPGGADALAAALERRVAAITAAADGGDGYEAPAITRARHRERVERALRCLEAVIDDPHLMPELVAEELRSATTDLAAVVGAVDTEQVLDVLFADFCIGK